MDEDGVVSREASACESESASPDSAEEGLEQKRTGHLRNEWD